METASRPHLRGEHACARSARRSFPALRLSHPSMEDLTETVPMLALCRSLYRSGSPLLQLSSSQSLCCADLSASPLRVELHTARPHTTGVRRCVDHPRRSRSECRIRHHRHHRRCPPRTCGRHALHCAAVYLAPAPLVPPRPPCMSAVSIQACLSFLFLSPIISLSRLNSLLFGACAVSCSGAACLQWCGPWNVPHQYRFSGVYLRPPESLAATTTGAVNHCSSTCSGGPPVVVFDHYSSQTTIGGDSAADSNTTPTQAAPQLPLIGITRFREGVV